MEVGSALNILMESLEVRKNNKFLSMALQNEIQKVGAVDEFVTKERVLETTDAFYG